MSGAHTGDLVLVEFCVAAASASVGSLTWKTLGAMRGKSIKISRDVKDVTADDSAAAESIVTKFVTMELSGDGVARDEAVKNQQELEAIVSDGSAQPEAWFRVTYPTGKRYTAPCIVSEWSIEAPHDDAITWSLTAKNNGAVTFTPGAPT